VSVTWLARRLLFAAVALVTIASLTFALAALAPDPNLARLQYATRGMPEVNATALVQEYEARRHLNDPLYVQYAEWLAATLTFRWGESFRFGGPVTRLVVDAGLRTAAYVLPAMAFATLFGLFVGVSRALAPGSWLGRGAAAVAYLAVSLPNFFVGEALVYYTTGTLVAEPGGMQDVAVAGFRGSNPAAPLGDLAATVVLPGLVLATGITVSLLRFTRAQAMEHAASQFVDVLRGKGVGPLRLTRHVLHNAAIPLVSVAFTELLGVLVVATLVIETIFNIPGLGYLVVVAVSARDMPLLLGVVTTIGLLGIAANLLQDVAYTVLDPRVGTT
jgi:peptide/nickel transport system permease protein